MIVLDANVLIPYFKRDDAHDARAFKIIGTGEALAMHPITLAECAVGPTRAKQVAFFRQAIGQLGLDIWKPDDEHPFRLAQLRIITPLKLPDCCALDTARYLGATLATFDQALAKQAKSLGVEVTGGQ